MNSEVISFVLSKNLKEKIEIISKEKNISRNALIRLALSEFVERVEKNT